MILRFTKWLFFLFLLLGMLTGGLLALSIDAESSIEPQTVSSIGELKRLKQFIAINRPSDVQAGQRVHSLLSEQDLNLIGNYLLQKAPRSLLRRMQVNFSLEPHLAFVRLSSQLGKSPLWGFINLQADMVTGEPAARYMIQIRHLRVSDYTLPEFVGEFVTEYIHNKLQQGVPEYALANQSIEQVRFDEKELVIDYRWDPDIARQIKSQLSSRILSEQLRLAVIAHSNYLAELSHTLPKKPSLNDLIKPMFEHAVQRSVQGNPAIENQAVFIVLGAYALRRNIPELLDEQGIPDAKYMRVYLKKRHDLSKHLMLSAAITSMANSHLAKSIVLQKEVRDSTSGSGFSFADLAADHAGIVLAQRAMASEQLARQMQIQLAQVKAESDYMLDVDNLPEGLAKNEFEQAYASTKSEAYKKMEQIIKQRITKLPIYSKVMAN